MKTNIAKKMAFVKDEADDIREYKEALPKSKGKAKKVYRENMVDEEEHLAKLKKL